MYKVLAGIIALFITNTALALEGEYKNSLAKIDMNKSSDSSYSINLYTSKEFSEPVKVIKKSDLNYYILLPETKNAAQKFSVNNPDIRSVDTQLFPYAGADLKNGYTKININTTKPINFTVKTKILTASSQQPSTVAEIKKEIKTASEDVKVQKKNLVSENKKQNDNLADKNSKAANTQKEFKGRPMAAAKILPKKIIENNIVSEQKKETPNGPKNAGPQQTVQVEENSIQEQQSVFEEENQIQTEVNNEAEKLSDDIQEQDIQQEEQPENVQKVQHQAFKIKAFNFSSVAEKIKDKLSEYGLNLKEFLLMLIAGILSFIAMLSILTRNKDVNTRLKSKADFIDKKSIKNASLHPKKNKQDKAQCFIFDNGVHQTGFIAPASNSKKNYELSSYEPSLHKTSTVIEPYRAKQVKSEYDILQNILKEDAFIELTDEEVTQVKEQQTSPVSVPQMRPQEIVKVSPQALNAEKDEPEILSSVEIAPQRGFMCVSYNNSISLVGYIFDDVFALYNFQQPKLENYNIRFRLSEKTQHGANFLVRVDKTKMLIGVTKSSMNLELAF